MAKVFIEFNIDNAWFHLEPGAQKSGTLDRGAVVKVVERVAESISLGINDGVVLDGNGDHIGNFEVEEK